MKASLMFIALIGSLLGSCATQDGHESEDKPSANHSMTEITSNCYAYTNGRDTITMELLQLGAKVSGKLKYDFYEKDRNEGTVEGELKGDTLLVDYTFMAEGMNSVRQVAFLKKGDEWVEGYGDVEGMNGRMNFKDPKTLKFNSIVILKKENCSN